MMTKLHKIDGNEHHYWEAWTVNQDVVFHWGIVGETGERRIVSTTSEGEASKMLHRESAAISANGFRLVEREDLVALAVNYALTSWGSAEDLETRHYVEDLCNQALGWTGNGYCDGGDIGSRVMNIWCWVLDALAAVKTLSSELRTHGLSDGAVIARYDDSTSNYLAIWPDGSAGQVVEV